MDNETACKMMFQSVDETSGHLIVEFASEGTPILATDFAKIIAQTVKCLNAIGEATEAEPIKWAIIEANIIGDLASFTLKGYGKEVFKTEKRKAVRAEVTDAKE
jgi:hypothetical protein